MTKVEAKTQRSNASVAAFLAAVEDETRRKDAKAIDKLLRDITGEKPYMLGSSIVGYGSYESASGDWPMVGFSPRKTNLVLYIMPGFTQYDTLLKKLGKHKTGKSCLYINKLADVDEKVLRELASRSWDHMTETYG